MTDPATPDDDPTPRRSLAPLGALSFGFAGCMAGLGAGYWFASLEPVSDVSLCWAFRPWPWRGNDVALVAIGGAVGAWGGAWLMRQAERYGARLADRVS